MYYTSTRGRADRVSFAQAVSRGIAPDGGLYVPDHFPTVTREELAELGKLSYSQLAAEIISLFATDFSDEETDMCVARAYDSGRFPKEDPAPVKKLNSVLSVLELWHGPTCAFKDMALQILPAFMITSKKELGDNTETVILTATSGDTGKAALEGFKDVPGIRVIVFYPEDGVSLVQQYQMTTQEGGNVSVIAVEGNFDDAQTGVKRIFTDTGFAARLEKKGIRLSSANSINWGRLLPQIVYYFHGYLEMAAQKTISLGERINICVPTGNFGNILAAYYAAKMGLPVNRLICASNENNVLTDFIHTGTYDSNRKFCTTISPAMDILVSSNLERLVYDMTECDAEAVSGYMDALKKEGLYTVDSRTAGNIQNMFWAGFADREETLETIGQVYAEYDYLADPHTAVGMAVYSRYRADTGDNTQTLLASTASPFKFNRSVSGAVFGSAVADSMSEFTLLDYLSEKTGLEVPGSLSGLNKKEIRHKDRCAPKDMEDKVAEILGL